MLTDNDVTNKRFNNLTIAQIVLICVLLVIFIFGISCVCSKFISVNEQNSAVTVFNKTTMEITDDFNAPNFSLGDKIVVTKTKNFSVGDFVVLNSSSGSLNSSLLMEIVGISSQDNTIVYQLKQSHSDTTFNATIEYIFGKVTSNSGFTHSFVLFLLSAWPLWLFVIFPGVVLLAVLIMYSVIRIKSQSENTNQTDNSVLDKEAKKSKKENNKNNDEIEAENKDTIENKTETKNKKSKDKQKQLQQTNNKEKKVVIGDLEQLTFDLDNLKKEKPKQKEPEPPILQDLRAYQNKLENERAEKAKKPKPKLYLHHKPKNDKRDNYVFEKAPQEDTNKPIKQMLRRFNETDSSQDNKNVNDLLKKMRNEANKNDGE